jgi:hypothetical protein
MLLQLKSEAVEYEKHPTLCPFKANHGTKGKHLRETPISRKSWVNWHLNPVADTSCAGISDLHLGVAFSEKSVVAML